MLGTPRNTLGHELERACIVVVASCSFKILLEIGRRKSTQPHVIVVIFCEHGDARKKIKMLAEICDVIKVP